GLQAGTNALSFNAGLNYSQQGGISANAGLGRGLGKNGGTGSYSASLNLGVSYSRQDGFGMNAGISSNNNHVLPGMGATISRSEYSGWGADVSTDQYGKVEGGGGNPSFGGVSGGLSWSERDGFTASFNVAGTNALSYNSQSGLSSNADFISQYSMNNILAQGVADTDEEKAYKAAKAEADSRAAQNRNNQHQGADAVSGAGYRRDEDGVHYTVDGDAESSDNIGGDSGKGMKPTPNEVEAMMNRYNKYQEGLDSIRNTKTTHYNPSDQEGSNIVRSVRTEKGENGGTKITIDRQGTVGFDAQTTPFFNRDSKGNLVPVTDGKITSPFIGHREVTNSAHNGIDAAVHAFRASANLEITGVTHGASRNVDGDPTKQAGIWVEGGKLMTHSRYDVNGFPNKSGKGAFVEYSAAIAHHDGVSAQDHANLLNHATNNPSQYHGNGNSVTGRYTMSDGTKVDLIYKHAPSLEGLQNGKPVIWQKGNSISQGDMVVNVGSTGKSTGPHAHFEVQSRSTLGLDLKKNADVIREIPRSNGVYAIDGRFFTNNILKKDLEKQ
ncbi:peptidase, M23 domain protein, partial [Leptospira borgpetersenii serovar Pomona str. 200901868]